MAQNLFADGAYDRGKLLKLQPDRIIGCRLTGSSL
jgi:hypothetical protein